MAYSKKPTYSFPDINSTGINKIPQGRIITVDDYLSGKPEMFLTNNLQSLSDSNTISDAINQGLLIENVKTQKTIKVITVGTGGDFTNLLSAIQEAKAHTNKVEINLISDLNVTGDISIIYLNGNHIALNFNNFKIINTNPTTVNSFGLYYSSIGHINNLNLQGYEFVCNFNSKTFLGGIVNIQNKNYNSGCMRIWRSSTVSIYSEVVVSLSKNGNLGSIDTRCGAIVSFENNTINDTSTIGTCFNVYLGSVISLGNSKINTTTTLANQAANTPTSNGIIFGNYSL